MPVRNDAEVFRLCRKFFAEHGARFKRVPSGLTFDLWLAELSRNCHCYFDGVARVCLSINFGDFLDREARQRMKAEFTISNEAANFYGEIREFDDSYFGWYMAGILPEQDDPAEEVLEWLMEYAIIDLRRIDIVIGKICGDYHVRTDSSPDLVDQIGSPLGNA